MKHYLVLLLLVFLLHLQAAAQINYTEKFKKELATHPAEDTFRVNRLNEMSSGFDLSTAILFYLKRACLVFQPEGQTTFCTGFQNLDFLNLPPV